MKYFYFFVSWVFGVLFFFLGSLYIFESFFGGVFLFLIAFLFLPPVRSFVFLKTNKHLNLKVKASFVFLLFIGFSFFYGDAKKQYFIENREEIIANADQYFADGDYEKVVSEMSEYLSSGDATLQAIVDQSSVALAEKKEAEEAVSLLAELAAISESELDERERLYERLLELYPENDKYLSGVASIAEKKKAEEAASLLGELETISESELDERERLYERLLELYPENDKYSSGIASIAEKKKAEETASLLAELEKVSESELDERKKLYGRLSALNPYDGEFYKKIDHYNLKIEEKSRPITLSRVIVRHYSHRPERDDYQVGLEFNRALTEKELKAGSGYNHQYGVSYKITSENGWESYSNIKPVVSMLLRSESGIFLMASESSHNPLRGYKKETDDGFKLIEKIDVFLYMKNQHDISSEYEIIESKSFTLGSGLVKDSSKKCEDSKAICF